jgi:ATP-dependent DNA helicase RecG
LVTLFKNKYSTDQLQKFGLNERQIKAILYIVEHGSITNSKYQEINAVGKTLATEELKDLIGKELIKQAGSKGRGSKYELKE